MAEYEAALGTMLMDGLIAFRPMWNPTEQPSQYARLVGQYVEALVHACVTQEELARALRMIRRDRKDRFWPTIAEVLEVAADARVLIRSESRLRTVPALPAPKPEPTAADRTLISAKMGLLAKGLAIGEVPPLREIEAEAEKIVAGRAA